MSKYRFGPKLLETAVFVVCSRTRVRSKIYILNLIRRTHFMVVRPKKLSASAWSWLCAIWVSQKVLKIMEFGSLRESVRIARVWRRPNSNFSRNSLECRFVATYSYHASYNCDFDIRKYHSIGMGITFVIKIVENEQKYKICSWREHVVQ